MSPNKPLGHKAYGSIPHLPGSRMGPGDHHCHAGQQTICWTKVRDRHDRIIVTEKLDGSNVSIARIGDEIVALGRAGYLAQTSKYEQHQLFAMWVRQREDRFREALEPGQRLVGEWLAQAHGTRYALAHEPFVAFDLMTGQSRFPWDMLTDVCTGAYITPAAVLSDGPAFSLEQMLPLLTVSRHGAIDPVEGAVWRVESRGKFDFIAKWVRPDKRDGVLLPEISGTGETVWNWRPEASF